MNNHTLLTMSDQEFNELVSKAFDDYRKGDMLALSNSPLAHSSLTAPCFLEGEPITPAVRGPAMVSVLRWAVDTLKPGGEHSWAASQWSHYNILHGYYLYMREEYEERLTIEKLAEQMYMAKQSFYYRRETAFHLVGERLRNELKTPQAAEERQTYAFENRYASLSSDKQLLLRIGAIFRVPIPIKLLHQLANEPKETNIQESIFGKQPWAGEAIQQRTIQHSIILYGTGLHSGKKSGMSLEPLPPNSGSHFVGVSGGPAVPAHVDFVDSTTHMAEGFTAMGSRTYQWCPWCHHPHEPLYLLAAISVQRCHQHFCDHRSRTHGYRRPFLLARRTHDA